MVIGIGLAFGGAGAFALTRVMRSLLFEVSPLDPLAFAAAVAMTVIAFRRLDPGEPRDRVDAMTAMRSDNREQET